MLRTGHRFDYNTPIEETMQALHDVVKAGWVRYVGMSSCYAYQCTSCHMSAKGKALTKPSSPSHAKYVLCSKMNDHLVTDSEILDYAISHNLTPFISMQNHYNLIYREEEREMFPTLKVI